MNWLTVLLIAFLTGVLFILYFVLSTFKANRKKPAQKNLKANKTIVDFDTRSEKVSFPESNDLS